MVHSHYHVNHHMTRGPGDPMATASQTWAQKRHHAEADHRGSPWFTKLHQFHVITRWILWFMHVCARYIGLIHLQLGGLSLQNTLGIHVGLGIQGVRWPHPSFLRVRPLSHITYTWGDRKLPCLITLRSQPAFSIVHLNSAKYVLWATVGLPKSDVYVAL